MAMGFKVLDDMVKLSPIRIIQANTISGGKYIIVFTGDVASVEYSFGLAKETARNYLVDSLYLPMVHEDVIPAMGNIVPAKNWDTIGIIETLSVSSAIEAADIGAKEGGVKIVEIRLGIGFGGKSFFKMMGDLNEVEAAMATATAKVKQNNQHCMDVIIPQPHSEVKPFFM